MTQNQHQVSIIGSMEQPHVPAVSRSFSSSSAAPCQEQERTSPEGRSCGDLEQDMEEEEEEEESGKLKINHRVSVHNVKSGLESEDVTSFSSCYKYQTPTSNLSREEEYLSPKELFADIGIKFIDCEETDGKLYRDDDTSISSFTSTYQTPSSAGSDSKLARDLSREMKETADLGKELSKHVVDLSGSLNNSDFSSNCEVNVDVETLMTYFKVTAFKHQNRTTPVQNVVVPADHHLITSFHLQSPLSVLGQWSAEGAWINF